MELIDLGKKTVVAGLALATSAVLLAPAAYAGEVDTESDDFKRGAFALVVLLIIAAVWFFVFRNTEDDTGRESNDDYEGDAAGDDAGDDTGDE